MKKAHHPSISEEKEIDSQEAQDVNNQKKPMKEFQQKIRLLYYMQGSLDKLLEFWMLPIVASLTREK